MKRVRAALDSLPEAAAVEIDFARKTATVTARAGKTIEREQVDKALAASGYGVTSFTCEAPTP